MKGLTIFLAGILVLISCNHQQTQNEQKLDTLKVVERNEDGYEFSSKRSYGDLIDNLYDKLAEKTPELKELERKIELWSKMKTDSTELFEEYNGKNQAYYQSAKNHVQQISDSLLRKKMQDLISGSLARYNSTVSSHRELLKSIEAKQEALNDLHILLKLTRTLPMMEKYQKEKLPAVDAFRHLPGQLDDLIRSADTLTRR